MEKKEKAVPANLVLWGKGIKPYLPKEVFIKITGQVKELSHCL